MKYLLIVLFLTLNGFSQWLDTIITIPRTGYSSLYRTAWNHIENKLYIMSATTDEVFVIDGATNSILKAIPVGRVPYDLIFNPNNNRVYCANGVGLDISVIDCATDSVVKTIPILQAFPNRMFLNSRENKIYLITEMPTRTYIIDCTGDTIIKVLDRTTIWTYNLRDNKAYGNGVRGDEAGVIVIDGKTDSIIKIILPNIGGSSFRWIPMTNKVYFLTETVQVIDCATDSIIKSIPQIEVVTYSFIPNLLNNKVYTFGDYPWCYVIDSERDSVIKRIEIGYSYGCLIWNSLNNKIYFGLAVGDTIDRPDSILIIDCTGDSLLSVRFEVGENVSKPAFNETDNRVYFPMAEWDWRVFIFRDVMPGIVESADIKKNNEKIEILPNPFRSKTVIHFSQSANHNPLSPIRIYDKTGRLVKSFSVPVLKRQEVNKIIWNGTDDFNKRLSAGVYFLRLETKDYQATKKIILAE